MLLIVPRPCVTDGQLGIAVLHNSRIFGMGAVLIAVLAGILLGVGGFTGYYGEGLSYFSREPAACTNCHIMRPQFDSWQKASHHTAAGCVDCHLPQEFFSKYLSKAENGWNHSKAFTLQNFHEPIQITPKNRQILELNCLRCHLGLVHGMATDSPTAGSIGCVHCHRAVGHGEAAGLGGPEHHRNEKDLETGDRR